MKTLFFECNMGAAGDMLCASILELYENRDEKIRELNELRIPQVTFEAEDSFKCGIKGTGLVVKVDGQVEDEHMHEHSHEHCNEKGGCESGCGGHSHGCNEGQCEGHSHQHDHDHHDNCGGCHSDEHGCGGCGGHHHNHHHNHEHEHHHHHDHEHGHSHIHRGMKEITEIVNNLNMKDSIKDDVIGIYNLIAEAESISHNVDVKEIHFHEVGNMDAIADITAFCYLLDGLDVKNIIASPVNLGGGFVKCAHGTLPVPAPATAYILKDVPVYSGEIKSELCTPTGAAILKHFANKFVEMPTMKIEKIGYGMGKKDFEVCNCVRAFLGEVKDDNDIIELSCNIDDMTGEDLGFAMEILSKSNALDVYTTSISMKKSRPGTLLSVLCKEEHVDEIVKLIFKHTSTIGIRQQSFKRYTLERSFENLDTKFGQIKYKKSKGYDIEKVKIEHDDLCKIAKENNLSLSELKNMLEDRK